MPMFTFVCQDCGAPFEEWVPVNSMVKDVDCPECHSRDVLKQLSRVAGVKGGISASIGTTAATAAACHMGGG
jgi:putative FmdB family regulatory protein